MSGRNSQVARIYRIMQLIEGSRFGLTVSDITEMMLERGYDVQKRTIYRDLEALQAAGFPLESQGSSDDHASRWTMEHEAKVGGYLTLGARELLALYLARSVLAPLEHTPFYDDLQSIFKKIDDKLGSAAKAHLDELYQEFKFEPGPKWSLGLSPDVIDTVRAACTERQILQIDYASARSGRKDIRRVGPHFLYFAKGSLYLIAEELNEGIVKTFALSRIKSAQLLDEPYEGQRTDPETYFSKSFGIYRGDNLVSVVIRFSPEIAPFASERRWHKSQRLVTRPTGEVDISLEVSLTPDLLQWVLGFGAGAKVIQPLKLAELVREEALKIGSLYLDEKQKTG
jgi:predicted DNA-binding transcriptional regulator YafY